MNALICRWRKQNIEHDNANVNEERVSLYIRPFFHLYRQLAERVTLTPSLLS